MAQNKTQRNDGDVLAYLESVAEQAPARGFAGGQAQDDGRGHRRAGRDVGHEHRRLRQLSLSSTRAGARATS